MLSGLVPFGSFEGESDSYLSPSFCCVTGSLWHSWASRHISLISAFIFTWNSPCVGVCVQIYPFYKDIVILIQGPTLLQGDLILTNNIYNNSYCEVLGVRTSTYELGGSQGHTAQHITIPEGRTIYPPHQNH